MDSINIANFVLFAGSVMILLGIFSSLIAKRFGAPLVLVFLVLGMLLGEDGIGGLVFSDYYLTYVIGSLALAIILFDGGLRTKLGVSRYHRTSPAAGHRRRGDHRRADRRDRNPRPAQTGHAGSGAARQHRRLDRCRRGVLSAALGRASASLACPLDARGRIGHQRSGGGVPDHHAGRTGGVGRRHAGLGRPRPARPAGRLGGALGVASGLGAVWLLNRIDMPGGLHPLFVVAGAVFIYALTSILGGSGLLAAYLAGLVLANRPVRAYPSIVAFHDAATWLAQIGMFLVLGLLVTPSTLLEYALPGLAVAAFLILVARPAAVWLCLAPFGFTRNEKLYFSWVGLRGAVSVFLAAIPTLVGVPQAEVYFNMAFFVVLVSLMVQGWTVNSSARRLGLALRRTAPAVTRIELDIPGQTGQEMVGYPVSAESMVLGLTRLPAWARLIMVVRGNTVLSPEEARSCTPAITPIFSSRRTAFRASTGCSAAPRTWPAACRRCSANCPSRARRHSPTLPSSMTSRFPSKTGTSRWRSSSRPYPRPAAARPSPAARPRHPGGARRR
jgi:potassium/hydrogen antiporter